MSDAVSPKMIRERLSQTGKTHADVAEELGVARSVVSAVLYGQSKCKRGDAHKVAVALGLKQGTTIRTGMSVVAALKAIAA